MISKLRKALEEVVTSILRSDQTVQSAIEQIITRYGDLEFTREELMNFGRACYKAGAFMQRDTNPEMFRLGSGYHVNGVSDDELEDILAFHTEGESESGGEEEPDLVDAVLDYRTREGMATLDDLCKRVAAIERRLLVDGHSEDCPRGQAPKSSPGWYFMPYCTCGHDKIRENSNA